MVGNITFTGLFSGLSTDEIVSALVGLKRTPITQLNNLTEQRGFEKKALQSVNTQILALKRTLLTLRLESTFLTKTATSSSPNVLDVKAGFNSQPGSHTVTIQSIARGARAVSGLNDRNLERAAAKLVGANTAGITGLTMTANSLGGTRAVASSLLTETLQSGKGSAAVTAGDKIKIDVTLKDGSTNTVYFTFAGNASDTLERLRQAINTAFRGEAQVSIDSNGAFLITETDTSAPGSLILNNLTFIDADYSGSTFSISTGSATPGGTSTYRTITGTRTFTTGSSANIASGTETLVSLDQWSGGSLDGDEVIRISGTLSDGTSVTSSLAVNASTTLNDLIAQLQSDFTGINVSIQNGKIFLRDSAPGNSQTSIGLSFYDPDNSVTFNMGAFVTTEPGTSDISQTIRTSGFAVPAIGKHLVTVSEGRGGVVKGTVSLNAGTILSSLGVTETSLFTIDRDNGGGAFDPVTIFGITSQSTVQDLIDAINAQVPGVTAQLVDDGAGAYNLQIAASRGGVDIRLTDESTGSGILEKVLNPDTGSIDTDISTRDDAGLSSVNAATSLATDYTFTTVFKPSNGGPVQIRTVVGSDGTAVSRLIENATINGAGNRFNNGVALIYTNQSSELNVGPATSTHLIGTSGISDPSRRTTPPLNIYTYANNSGLDIPLTSGTVTINGVRINIGNPATQTLDEIMGLVNSSGAGVLMEYDPVFDRFILYRPDAGNTSPITIGAAGDTSNFAQALGLRTQGGAVQFAGTSAGIVSTTSALAFSGLSLPVVSGTFTINGVKISVSAGADSLQDIIQRINNSPAGVIASYDISQDRFVLTQDLAKPQLFDQILIGSPSDTSNFLASMRLTDSYQVPSYIGSSRVKAQFTVDGETYVRDSNTITDVLQDLTLTLKGISSEPIALDIVTDTSLANRALRDFVVAYNKLIEIVDPEPLTDDERKKLASLSESDRKKMTESEINEYKAERERLWLREMINQSNILSRMDNAMRVNLFSPVSSIQGGNLRTLFDIGISTGSVGFGVEAARTAYLVYDTTDPDIILQKLQEKTALQDALKNNPRDVFNLFSAAKKSTAELIGNINISAGISVGAPLSFSIGNGTTQATVNFGPGYYSASQVLSRIIESVSQAGLSNEIRVYQTTGGFLQIVATKDSDRARLSIQDLGGGSNVAEVLGIGSQSIAGEDALLNAGISNRLDSFFDGYVGRNGIIKEKIKLGGLIDRDLLQIAKRINDYEYRLNLYGARLRTQFAQMEIALTAFQKTSQFLQAQLQAANLTNNQSSGGISISL